MTILEFTREIFKQVKEKTSLPSGGTAGQVLTKTSSADGDVSWQNQSLPAIDESPTIGSNNLVKSGGIASALNSISSGLSSSISNGLASKQNKLTFDIIPTSGSSNPVTSDGVYRGINIQIQEPLSRKQDLLMTDNVGPNVGFTVVNGRARISFDDSEILELLKDTIGYTTKNKLPFPYREDTKTESGITFTVNLDGSITVNGTATAHVSFVLADVSASLFEDGESYIVSDGGVSVPTQYFLFTNGSKNGDVVDYDIANPSNGNPATLVIDQSTYDTYRFALFVTNGTTVNNVTFYPMIRSAKIFDDTYEKYHAAGGTGGTTYTFDNVPTSGSDNPVTSDGIYTAISAAIGQALNTSY